MALKFGTSGVRGLVTEMSDRECYLYARSFLQVVKARTTFDTVALAGDYRPSTPRIMKAVGRAILDEGLQVDLCGFVATPTVTLHGMARGIPSIMVTGSHVPADRNGIKFNMPWGEVLKADEQEIVRQVTELRKSMEVEEGNRDTPFTAEGDLKNDRSPDLGEADPAAARAYVDRYLTFFPEQCLEGRKVVFYQHSSVSRTILPEIIEKLGARVEKVGWSDTFVPVDTEAVEEPERLAAWVREHGADVLCTTDGDGDRPLVVDDKGEVLRGDVLGILVADALQAACVATPVSCNTALEKSGRFKRVARTRIGSPFVIEAMIEAGKADLGNVVGYEANGGFLTGTDITSQETGKILKALPTRDAALPILAVIHLSVKQGRPVSALTASLPPRYTFSGLLRPFPTEQGRELVASFQEDGEKMAGEYFGKNLGPVKTTDFTDGARLVFASDDVVHLRPSGNAPEFRCYTEAATEERAREVNKLALEILKEKTGT